MLSHHRRNVGMVVLHRLREEARLLGELGSPLGGQIIGVQIAGDLLGLGTKQVAEMIDRPLEGSRASPDSPCRRCAGSGKRIRPGETERRLQFTTDRQIRRGLRLVTSDHGIGA